MNRSKTLGESGPLARPAARHTASSEAVLTSRAVARRYHECGLSVRYSDFEPLLDFAPIATHDCRRADSDLGVRANGSAALVGVGFVFQIFHHRDQFFLVLLGRLLSLFQHLLQLAGDRLF